MDWWFIKETKLDDDQSQYQALDPDGNPIPFTRADSEERASKNARRWYDRRTSSEEN